MSWKKHKASRKTHKSKSRTMSALPKDHYDIMLNAGGDHLRTAIDDLEFRLATRTSNKIKTEAEQAAEMIIASSPNTEAMTIRASNDGFRAYTEGRNIDAYYDLMIAKKLREQVR